MGGALHDRRGPRLPVTVGMLGLALGMFLMTGISSSTTYDDLIIPFIITGAAIGVMITPMTESAVGSVEEAHSGGASGVFKAGSMVGGSLGVAVCGAFFQGRSDNELASLLSADNISVSASQLTSLESLLTDASGPSSVLSSFSKQTADQIVGDLHDAFVYGMSGALWAPAVLALGGAIAAFLLLKRSA